MRRSHAVVAVFGWVCCAAWVYPQQRPVYVDPQVAGIFTHISERIARVEPMLGQIRTAEWVSKGAPETYTAQLESARRQAQAIQTDMTALAQRPDQLQPALRGLFRVQTFQLSLDSLMGGLRKYQNPALAELIESVTAQNQADLEALENYLLELAAGKEQELTVMNNEAQRCRAMISQQPLPSAVRKK